MNRLYSTQFFWMKSQHGKRFLFGPASDETSRYFSQCFNMAWECKRTWRKVRDTGANTLPYWCISVKMSFSPDTTLICFWRGFLPLHLLIGEPRDERCSSGTKRVPRWCCVSWLLELTQLRGSRWGFVCKRTNPPCEDTSETAEAQNGFGRRDL